MEVWEWIPFLKRRKWSILVFTVLTVAVTMAVSFIIPPSYESTAILQVQPLTQNEPLSYPSAIQLSARNVGELVKSPTVEKRAAQALGRVELQGEPEFRVYEQSGLVQIIVVGESPEDAAAEANAMADAYLAFNTEMLRSGAEKAQAGLEAQLTRLRKDIAETEAELDAARELPDGAGAVSELQDRLDSLNTAYEGVLTEIQILPASETELSTSVFLADAAVPEPEPVSPKIILNLLLSVVGGMLLGIAFARATESPAGGHEKSS